MTLPNYLTTSEAAARLDVHPETVRRLCVDGKLDARWTGHAWAIHEDVVVAYRRRELLRQAHERAAAAARDMTLRDKRRQQLRRLTQEEHECDICGRVVRGRGAFGHHRKACARRQREATLAALARRLETPPEAQPVGWLVQTPFGWQMQVDGRVVGLRVVEDAVLRLGEAS